jgi:hypothetical protein
VRREATVAALVLAASATALLGGGARASSAPHAQPPGVYEAAVSGRIGENILRERVWFSVPAVRFRDWSTLDYLGPVSRTLSVFDGHRARMVARFRDGHTEIEDIHGAPGFAQRGASGPAVVILDAYLTGDRLPRQTRLDVTRTHAGVLLVAQAVGASYRLVVTRHPSAPSPGFFRLPAGQPALVETQPRLDAAAASGRTPPYWQRVSIDGRDESMLRRL